MPDLSGLQSLVTRTNRQNVINESLLIASSVFWLKIWMNIYAHLKRWSGLAVHKIADAVFTLPVIAYLIRTERD